MTGIIPREDRRVAVDPAALLGRARQARQLRATMGAFLPRDLLVDPAWDMMLDLFIAAGTGEHLYVKDVILMSGESAGSAMRRIDRLQEAGMLVRYTAPDDHRRVRIDLTLDGRFAMATMLEHLFDHHGSDDEPRPKSFAPGTLRAPPAGKGASPPDDQ